MHATRNTAAVIEPNQIGRRVMRGVGYSRVCAKLKEGNKDMLVARTSALIVCGISCLLSPEPGSSASTIREEGATLLSRHQERPAASYRIKPKDELDIRIEEACIYVTRFDVEERGFIEVPFAGEVQAAGKTVAELSSDLTSELKKYMKAPKVHVRVTEART